MSRGFNAVYAYFLLAAGATFFLLVLGLPGGWNRWSFVEFFTIFGLSAWYASFEPAADGGQCDSRTATSSR